MSGRWDPQPQTSVAPESRISCLADDIPNRVEIESAVPVMANLHRLMRLDVVGRWYERLAFVAVLLVHDWQEALAR